MKINLNELINSAHFHIPILPLQFLFHVDHMTSVSHEFLNLVVGWVVDSAPPIYDSRNIHALVPNCITRCRYIASQMATVLNAGFLSYFTWLTQ